MLTIVKLNSNFVLESVKLQGLSMNDNLVQKMNPQSLKMTWILSRTVSFCHCASFH